jgi:hypothetical protein
MNYEPILISGSCIFSPFLHPMLCGKLRLPSPTRMHVVYVDRRHLEGILPRWCSYLLALNLVASDWFCREILFGAKLGCLRPLWREGQIRKKGFVLFGR